MLVWIALVKCFLEIASLLKIAEALTGQNGKRKNYSQYFIMAVMSAISVYVTFYDGSSLLQMVHYGGLFAILLARFRMSVFDTAIYTMFCFLIVGVLELFVYLPCNFLYRILGRKGDCSIIAVFVVFLICLFMERREIIIANRRWIGFYKEKINLRLITIIFAILLVFTVGLVRFDKGMSLEDGIYLLSALFMFLTLIYQLSGYQMEIEYHKRYADKYGEVVTELRERQHKFVNQLDSIYALCKIYDNYDELVQHQAVELDHLRKYLMPGKLLILERPLVVAHIYTKLCEAEEQGITVYTDFTCSLEQIAIPDIFLIEILGNLLDNAMDEVLTRNRHEQIKVSITDQGDEICLSVGNEHDKIPYKEYSKFFSNSYSKKGEGRGVGLPYLKKIVEKYHGHIQIGNVLYETGNYFVISIYFIKKYKSSSSHHKNVWHL